jgi:hypothetical protein
VSIICAASTQTLEANKNRHLQTTRLSNGKSFQSRAMKKTPLSSGGGEQRGKEVLKKFLFDLRVACHNNSLMVCRVSQKAKGIYVSTRKSFARIPRKLTVQRHRSSDNP